jgi:hypothetical protein
VNEFIDELGFKQSWERFLGGRWTRERPRKPGYYPVEGVQSGEPDGSIPSKMVLVYEAEGKLCFAQSWGGWWWSEPLPMLPPTPDCNDEPDCGNH